MNDTPKGRPAQAVAATNPPKQDSPVTTVTITGSSASQQVADTGGTSGTGVNDGTGGDASEKQQLKALVVQMHEMREMVMLALLENPSASERIRGVGYASDIKSVNKNVLDALFSTLNNDPNSNVRLMTLDALTRYADVPAVRRGLVQSILQQGSPLVQAAMADVMLRLQEKKAVQPLKELLQQKDLNEMVRTKDPADPYTTDLKPTKI
ncbi:HEAT repeat domain-containing protein [Puia sp. P3]|uniref:HEAT repeat domain-containing protein n=1 Tax=Puia sp. P3 TaxID=3423952 RepID=UPI003D671A14